MSIQDNPSGFASRNHLPLHKGGLGAYVDRRFRYTREAPPEGWHHPTAKILRLRFTSLSRDDTKICCHRIFPLGSMTTTLMGISLPLFSIAVFTAKGSPPQQGTCIRTMVTL